MSCNKLRCACGTHFGSNLRCACVRCILRLAKCDRKMAHYFGNNERNWLYFGVNYNFVAQICKPLAIIKKKKNKKKFGEIPRKLLGF